MNPSNLHRMINEAALKYSGQGGTMEAPRGGNHLPKKIEAGVAGFLKFLSPIKTDITHTVYGNISPRIHEVDPLGEMMRGDHTSLSSVFDMDQTLRLVANSYQDIANQNVTGTYEAVSRRRREAGQLQSATIFAVVTPGGSVRENTGYYRRSGEEGGSAYFSVSMIHERPTKPTLRQIKELIAVIYDGNRPRTMIRGAFLDFHNQKVPLAFSIENVMGKLVVEVCGRNGADNRKINIDELMEKIDEAALVSPRDVNFYIGGSFDI